MVSTGGKAPQRPRTAIEDDLMSQLIDLAAEFRENEAKLLVQYWQATGRIQNSYLDREPDTNTDGLEEWKQRIASEDDPSNGSQTQR